MPHGASSNHADAPRRTLLTGGAGFIGSHLAERLLARGDRLTVVDDLSTGRRENLPEHPRLTFIHADLGATLRAFEQTHGHRPDGAERFDEIYHLAAAVGVGLVMDDPARAIEINVGQTAELFRYAARQTERTREPVPVLIASSSEVYGKPDRERFSEDDDVIYGPTTVARWSYAAAKALDEHLALAHHDAGRVSAVVARLFNTVGPRQLGAYGMVLPRFVQAALRDEPLRVFGDGTQSRCFCDVRDVADALPRLLAEPAARGRVFNLGRDEPITIRELAELVIEELGSRSAIELVPYDRAYPPGFEDLHRRRPDLSRIVSAIGFRPARTLRETVRDLAEQMGGRAPSPPKTEPAPNQGTAELRRS
ncbi:MAG: NAD-dependent epimerase/dehydratase family protein [Phycisphaerales bacterium]|nr:MAG: NAD-dependent epimerase/dehydratase family protein [Phycisphaerales bacterium]